MKYSQYKIVFQEVPNEISLAFFVTWCPWHCIGCHSAKRKDWTLWKELSWQELVRLLNKYENYITTVLFFWWEWYEDELVNLLDIVEAYWLKACLYTWLYEVSERILSRLDYIKYWPYKRELGWLNSPKTNQRFINLKTKENLTHLFFKT